MQQRPQASDLSAPRRIPAPPETPPFRTRRRSDAAPSPAGRGSTAPDFELIVREPHHSFRWNVHGYPYELARWHYHPEYELHLIQRSSGKMFVGDFIGNFQPGTVVLSGPNLPHNWVSDIARGEEVKDRDMLIQFSDELLRNLMRTSPELEELEPLLDDARYGIEFHGDTAKLCARNLRRIGQATATRRMLLFLETLDELNRSSERRTLSSREYAPTLNHSVSDTINRVINFLIANLAEDIRLPDLAAYCGMSDSLFSRFFKKNTGHGFVRYINRMRINRACVLLTETDKPVTAICFETGFNNLSNFNRQFRAVCGLTPSDYRHQAKRCVTNSIDLYRDLAEPPAWTTPSPSGREAARKFERSTVPAEPVAG
jgi:AraC-like DNA-binding protein